MDKLKNWIVILLTAILPFLIYISNRLINDNTIFSYIILLFASIFVTWFCYFILSEFLYRFHFIRKLFDPLARFEGRWICTIEVENSEDLRVCGFYNFKFNTYEKCYMHSGENYDDNGNAITSFIMSNVYYSKQIHGFHFYGAVIRIANNKLEIINCWGEVRFTETKRKLNSAHGYFVNNSGATIIRAKTSIERIPKKDLKENDFEHQYQRAEYALQYWKERNNKI